jgi:O-antigen/teichoic acid export membrane protein
VNLNFLRVILKSDNILKSRFQNAIMLSVSQIFSLLFNFVSILIIAREISLQSFGVLSICLTIYSIMAIFSEVGIFGNIGTSLSKGKFNDSDLFGFTILISIILSIVFLILLCISYPIIGIFYPNNVQYVLMGSGLLSFSFLLPYALPFILAGSEKIKIFSLFNFSNNFLYFLFVVIQTYVFKNHSIYLYINFKSISIIISVILIFFLLKPTFLNQVAILHSIYQDWQKFGYHCFIGRLYNSTIPFLLVLIVGYVLSEKSAAIFRVSFNFINPLLLVFLSFTQSMAKKVSNMPAVPKSTFYSNLLISILLVIFSAMGCFILIEFFLGDKYKQSFPLFLIMLICCLLYGNYRMYYEWLVLNGHGKKVMDASKYAFLFIVLFAYPLLKMFDIYGAPLALVGSFSVCTIFVFYYYRAILKENIYEKKQEILDTYSK